MRFLCFLILLLVTLLEIGPIPISGLFLIWIVLFRPQWFYELICQIYEKPALAEQNIKHNDEQGAVD